MAAVPAAGQGASDQEEPAVWIRGGVLLAVWGLAWSVLAIAVIIPHFNLMHHYPYWYDGGAVGPGGHPSVGALAHQLVQSGHEKLWTTYGALLEMFQACIAGCGAAEQRQILHDVAAHVYRLG